MRPHTHRISIVGLGYVGLCTAATFASKGFKTIGIDVDREKIVQISQGRSPIHEPRLGELTKKGIRDRLLEATTDIARISETDFTFITVGTPSRDDGSIDLSYLKTATHQTAEAIRNERKYHLLAVKSTVIPGTTNTVVKPILEKSSGKSVGARLGLCVNPEFLSEGTAIRDSFEPDRIVIGANDIQSSTRLKGLYREFFKDKLPPVIVTSPETAELVKYASNSFLATKVSFINTIANIAQSVPGVDINEVAKAIGHDPRIGPLFLKAGPGYGGSCFHKDLQALISFSRKHDYEPVLLAATEETNEQQAERVVQLSEKLVGPLDGKRIAILGISFKKDTDDIRDAASIRVILSLQRENANIVAYDPMAIPNAKKLFDNRLEFAQNARSALKDADCCIIMTEWDEFKKLTPKDYTGLMRTPKIVDARRIYNSGQFKELHMEGIGLGPIKE